MSPELTKTDTRALWYAVEAYISIVKAMKDLPSPVPQDVVDKERQILTAAKRALRKVNAIRKAQTSRPSEKPQDQYRTAGGAGAQAPAIPDFGDPEQRMRGSSLGSSEWTN